MAVGIPAGKDSLGVYAANPAAGNWPSGTSPAGSGHQRGEVMDIDEEAFRQGGLGRTSTATF